MTTRSLSAASQERPVRVGRYQVTGLIRAGGMGTVYDAVDAEHGARVALKTLNHLGAGSLRRFKREFRAVADLSHPNLVSLYELACDDDLWFFTMERVCGVELVEALRGVGDVPYASATRPLERVFATPTVTDLEAARAQLSTRSDAPVVPEAPTSVGAVRSAFAGLARGVFALHRAGLLHLDIKPSNVLVTPAGRVVLLDFGLVRPATTGAPPPNPAGSPGGVWPFEDVADAPKVEGEPVVMISGTPEWMAPEQYIGDVIGAPADWYAVGLMLYVALTGVPAFAPTSVPLLAYAKLHARPPSPRDLVPDLPQDLSDLTMALLEPDPARRATGAALVDHPSAFGGDDEPRPSERPIVAAPTLVGRGAERAAFREALAHVAAGGAAVVHLVGPSGMGKTALLDALVADAAGVARVLRGRCYERESVPYKAFDGMLDALVSEGDAPWDFELPTWITEVSRVFPVLSAVHAVAARATVTLTAGLELRRRAREGLRELIARLAQGRPLVLAVDDLQWSDADSAAMLVKLVEPHAPRGLLICASYRSFEAAKSAAIAPYFDAIQRLDRRSTRAFEIAVGPLVEEDAAALARATFAALGEPEPEGAAAAIWAATGGVPLFVESLARSYAGADPRAALDAVLAARVRALPPRERALVETLAVADSPIPLAIAFEVARVDAGGRRALWALRAGGFVRAVDADTSGRVALHHDRLREAVAAGLARERHDELHLALGRALASRVHRGAWLFDAVRHLNEVAHLLPAAERRHVAALDLEAGGIARRAAAFPLAFTCLHAGAALVDDHVWRRDYDLALALHTGAAEAAYLAAAWPEIDAHVAAVKRNGLTILDQLPAWEVEIDAFIARRAYDDAVDMATAALRLLDVDLPTNPGPAEIGAEIGAAIEALGRLGEAGLVAAKPADEPVVLAAMRALVRVSSAAYFARPALFPIIACRLVAASAQHGPSHATPYALAVFGVVLHAIGKPREAHGWGQVALELCDRFEDKSLEPRTRHVIHDMVCVWTVPLASTLDDLRRVVALGREHGDLEYAAYAAHAYVHNALYAGRELGPLLAEAIELGAFMRGQDQVNALHVHAPFEQLLRCLTGAVADPSRLDGDGFDEEEALAVARASGSRSAQCLIELLRGTARLYFGDPEGASACFERARPFLDGVPATWHQPMLHQHAAIAIARLPAARRAELAGPFDESLAALRALAPICPANFEHRVDLVLGERALADGDARGGLAASARVVAALDASFVQDLALAHDIAARCHLALGDEAAASASRAAASAAYVRWGAAALTGGRPPPSGR